MPQGLDVSHFLYEGHFSKPDIFPAVIMLSKARLPFLRKIAESGVMSSWTKSVGLNRLSQWFMTSLILESRRIQHHYRWLPNTIPSLRQHMIWFTITSAMLSHGRTFVWYYQENPDKLTLVKFEPGSHARNANAFITQPSKPINQI